MTTSEFSPTPASRLRFEQGTLVLEGLEASAASPWPQLKWDERTARWRAPAMLYRDLVWEFYQKGQSLQDDARMYQKLPLTLFKQIVPREHQSLALKAWQDAGSRGVVCLPTGAGKTILAVMAIAASQRPALVVVPTIDLLHQWRKVLAEYFRGNIGALGGGERVVEPLTVATYDSALLLIERLGNQFGLIVFDECHHLPAPQYQMIARAAIAPFRLGLSATLERSDGQETVLYELLGSLVYEGKIREMVARVLAPYDVVNLQVPMTEREFTAYQEARGLYLGFVRKHRISFSDKNGWLEFIKKSAVMPGGREAMRAYRAQKRLAQASEAKIQEVWKIIRAHEGDRIIIFTDENSLAYRIGCELALPVLTHHTKPKERKAFLAAFHNGQMDILVTSKVLNEGVDVPEASIGIVVSGSGGVREHVQRLGRILRHQPGKRATLYEIVSKGTSEVYVNQRRRQHHAYQRSTEI